MTPCLCGGCEKCQRAQGFTDEEICEGCGQLIAECDCEDDEDDDDEEEWEL